MWRERSMRVIGCLRGMAFEWDQEDIWQLANQLGVSQLVFKHPYAYVQTLISIQYPNQMLARSLKAKWHKNTTLK